MNLPKLRLALSAVVALLCLLTVFARPARADRAIVIGINEYPNLTDANLAGCVNDAVTMQTVFQKYGFQVTLLTDDTATKQGILDAIKMVAATIKPDERFAFYYAGHGTPGKDSSANLLPSDAAQTSTAQDLSAGDLYDLLSAIPARSRTVILDSCFSGGMLRSARGLSLGVHPEFATRVFLRPDQRDHEGNSRDLVLVNKRDTNQTMASDGAPKICYFTASRENEQSGEDSFNGQRDGVFTHYLASQMTSGKAQQWSDVQNNVSSQVAAYTNDEQHPTLSPAYTGDAVFEAKPAVHVTTPVALKSNSLWDLYNADHLNPLRLLVTMDPDQTTVHVGDKLSFSTNVGAGGYLLILEHGVSGNVNLLFPTSRNVADAKVAGGKTINIPDPDKAYIADQPGTERVKALLFTDKAAAAAMLSGLPSSLSLPYTQMRALPSTAPPKTKFDTSDVTFEVAPAPSSAVISSGDSPANMSGG